MRQPRLQSRYRPGLPPPRLVRQAALLLESVPRPRRSRAGAEARTRHHVLRMAVHAAGESAAENGGRGGPRQDALKEQASPAIRVRPARRADGLTRIADDRRGGVIGRRMTADDAMILGR